MEVEEVSGKMVDHRISMFFSPCSPSFFFDFQQFFHGFSTSSVGKLKFQTFFSRREMQQLPYDEAKEGVIRAPDYAARPQTLNAQRDH